MKAVQYFDQNPYLYSRDFLIGSNGILGRFLIRIRLFLELEILNLKCSMGHIAYVSIFPLQIYVFFLLQYSGVSIHRFQDGPLPVVNGIIATFRVAIASVSAGFDRSKFCFLAAWCD